jgi:hypothetical protein
MDISELPEDSDTSDEDYLPEKKPEEVVSEVDSDGDPEDDLVGNEDAVEKPRKRTKHAVKSRKKQKHGNCGIEVFTNDEAKQLTEEEKKKKEEDVWADFMKDTGFKSRKERTVNVSANKAEESVKPNDVKLIEKESSTDKVKITEIFQFAGEEVTIEKEVPKDSAQARLLSKAIPESTNKSNGRNMGGLSGISGILSHLGKKPKITTLEKSKLDWDKFKKEENLEEELRTHNKGRDGYLEKQDFLQRADLRRFEIEKKIRTIERNKRVNNS